MQADRKGDDAIRDAAPYYSAIAPYGDLGDREDGFGVMEIFALLRRRWELILIPAVIGTALAAAYGYTRPLVFTATSTLLIEPENKIVDHESVVDGVGSDAIAIETQMKLIKSAGFLERFIREQVNQDVALAKVNSALEGLKSDAKPTSHTISDSMIESPQASEPDTQKKDWSVGSIMNALNVTQQGRSYLINIGYSSADPQEAAEIANAVAQHYIVDQTSRRRQVTSEANNVLGGRLAALKQELVEAEQAVEQYRQSNLLLDAGNFDVNSEQIADLTSLIVETRADRMEKEARLAYIQQLKAEGVSLESLTEVINSPQMSALWTADSALQSQLAELGLEFGGNHPKIQSIRAEREEIKDRIDWEIERIIANTQNELDVSKAREESINNDIARMTSSNNQAGIQLRILEGNAIASRRIYEDFLVRFKETSQQEQVIQANTRLIANAHPPINPSGRSPLSYAILGLVGSSALGFGLAFLRDKTDRCLRSAKEISKELQLTCLGLVPLMGSPKLKGRKVHEYLTAKPVSVYAESIRAIYTKLALMETDSPHKVIQITSSLPQEGKTTFAVSLATLLAKDGKRTILLDLDLRHPSVGREITLDDCISADSFLRGEMKFDPSLIQRDKKSGCYILGVKSAVNDPSRLLRSTSLVHLIEALRSEYEQIIIDGPPSLGLSDSKALLSHSDLVLFVVRWNKTPIESVVDTLDELRNCNAKIAGAVLAQVDTRKQKRYGYHGLDNYYGKHENYYNN